MESEDEPQLDPQQMDTTAAEPEQGSTSISHTEPEPTLPVTSGYVPSPSLMKTTKARIYDSKELESSKNRIKHEDDIWWETRQSDKNLEKVMEKEKDSIPKIDAYSKLHVPTVAFIKSTREKFPRDANSTTIAGCPKSPMAPGSVGKKGGPHTFGHSPAPDQVPPACKTVKINSDSPLLKPTKAAVVCQWNPNAPPPPPTPIQLVAAETGPKNVPSKLHKETVAVAAQKWKSKEQVQLEEQEKDLQAREAAASAIKVKSASERLMKFNASMTQKTVPKLKKGEMDPREKGWTDKYVKGEIPQLEKVFPAKKLGGSPTSTASLNKTEISVDDNLENTMRGNLVDEQE
eukprot:CAMPEP_0170087128 /NCGR_PEP_ID=MMETSP0019_2-20121128/21676_1 /TAXON_ID=98059 /ORGANISM="Dinobryon sp., Strain UTEXLB2267" /LENGTH=345 /DNA_ID=CAMNT_0010304609 /DNA_START=31 /DNA_END=1068 /DNA_ORIENTATION=+